MYINVYFRNLNQATLPIFQHLRQNRYRGIKLWLDEQCSINYTKELKDVKLIDRNCAVDNNLSYIEWDIETCSAGIKNCGLKHLMAA